MLLYILVLQFPTLSNRFDRIAIQFDPALAAATAITNAVLCACHVYGALRAVLRSICERRLTFGQSRESRVEALWTNTKLKLASVALATRQASDHWHPTCWKHVKSCWHRLGSWTRSFGVRGANFEVVFVLREVIEVTMQAIQCYRINRLVGYGLITRATTAALVLNCWSTPAIRIMFRRHEATARFLSLGVDSMLDIWTSVVVPLAIGYASYDRVVSSPDYSYYFTPMFFARFHSELQLVLSTSWLALVYQYFPGATMVRSLENMKSLILVDHSTVTPVPTATAITDKVHTEDQRRWFHRILDLVHGIFACVGLAIVIIYITSAPPEITEAHAYCHWRLRPWGGTKVACSVAVVDCVRDRIDGAASEIDALLGSYEISLLAGLTIAHCQHVQMPASLRDMTSLQTLILYNSTLERWDADAALSAQSHPIIQQLYFVRCNMSLVNHTLPTGIMGDDVPPTLGDLSIVEPVDQVLFPDNFAQAWRHEVRELVIDFARLNAVPPQFERLRVRDRWSFARNNLSEIPEWLVHTNASAVDLMLSSNPVVALPPRGKPVFRWFSIDNTDITAVPHWVLAPPANLTLWGFATPMCPEGSPAQRYVNSSTIDCTRPLHLGGFPDIDSWAAELAITIPS